MVLPASVASKSWKFICLNSSTLMPKALDNIVAEFLKFGVALSKALPKAAAWFSKESSFIKLCIPANLALASLLFSKTSIVASKPNSLLKVLAKDSFLLRFLVK